MSNWILTEFEMRNLLIHIFFSYNLKILRQLEYFSVHITLTQNKKTKYSDSSQRHLRAERSSLEESWWMWCAFLIRSTCEKKGFVVFIAFQEQQKKVITSCQKSDLAENIFFCLFGHHLLTRARSIIFTLGIWLTDYWSGMRCLIFFLAYFG